MIVYGAYSGGRKLCRLLGPTRAGAEFKYFAGSPAARRPLCRGATYLWRVSNVLSNLARYCLDAEASGIHLLRVRKTPIALSILAEPPAPYVLSRNAVCRTHGRIPELRRRTFFGMLDYVDREFCALLQGVIIGQMGGLSAQPDEPDTKYGLRS